MALFQTDLMLRRTVEDYCRARDDVIRHYRDAFKHHDAIDARLKTLGLFGTPNTAVPRLGLDEFIHEVDRSLWRLVFQATGLPRYMDEHACKAFDAELTTNPPAFEEDTIRSTLINTAAQAEEMFARGLYNLFLNRSDTHQTNQREPFAIPKKVIWADMIDVRMTQFSGRLQLCYHHRARLNDLDRMLRVLAGQPYEPFSFEGKLSAAFKQGDHYEDDLITVRGFKRGTLHVVIKNDDVLARANQILAKYAGAVIPDGRHARQRPST